MKRIFGLLVCLSCAVAGAAEVPRIFAHRGGVGEYDDNAVGAFVQSLAFGITGYELDVRATKDAALVVMHDSDVRRTTTGTGKVSEMTLDAFKALKLKKSGESPPALADVLAVFRGREDVRIEFEMKSCEPLDAHAYCRKLHREVSQALPKGTYKFTSFNRKILAAMHEVAPDAPTMLIAARMLDEALIGEARALGAKSIGTLLRSGGGKDAQGKARPVAYTTKEMVDKAHAAGLQVVLWPAPWADAYKRVRACGADSCTSDNPITVRAAMQAFDAKAADPALNTALMPLARLQKDGYDWFARHRRVRAEGAKMNPQIVFIGDSITHFWAGKESLGAMDDPATEPRWKETFGAYRTLNLGYGWDRTANVFWRLAHGEMDGIDPRVVVLHIGGNNLSTTENWTGNTPQEVVDAIAKLAETVHRKAPRAEILVMAVFPFGRTPESWHRPKIRILNAALAARMKDYAYVKYLDIHDRFLDAQGHYRKDLSRDSVHPNTEGYKIWAAALLPEFKRILGY